MLHLLLLRLVNQVHVATLSMGPAIRNAVRRSCLSHLVQRTLCKHSCQAHAVSSLWQQANASIRLEDAVSKLLNQKLHYHSNWRSCLDQKPALLQCTPPWHRPMHLNIDELVRRRHLQTTEHTVV
jgi:hypothetical protein